MRNAVIAAMLLAAASGANGGEGFGTFRNVVAMERLSPPQRVLAAKHVAIVFEDETQRAAPLRARIEAFIRESDRAMRIGGDAPYKLSVHVRDFLTSKTRAVAGTFTVTDRAERTLYDSQFSESNAGGLINDSDDRLVEEAAKDVARAVVPIRHHTAVVIPKGRLDAFASLADRGEWSEYLARVERLPESTGDAESYRLYALAVAHEAVGFASGDALARAHHLREAVQRNLAASRLKGSEKLFAEAYAPMSRAFASPALPPRLWIDPHAMELWDSVALVDGWMNGRPAPSGTLDNRSILDLAVAGRSDESMIAKIQAANRATFALGQTEMTALRNAGVPWTVIDAMRAKMGLPRRELYITPDSW